MNVLASLVVLGILILFHEAGHFFAATSQGIRVNGFSIGFGPALIKHEYKGVTYALRALPLGGYVSFPENETQAGIEENDPDLLQNRPIPQRLLVISAGVIANLLLAWFVLIGQAAFIGLPNQPEPGVLVVSVQSDEAAAASGIGAGDQILSINGVPLGQGQEAVQNLVEAIKAAPQIPLKLEKIEEDKKITLTITPTEREGIGKIGAQLQANISKSMRPPKDLLEVFEHADSQFLELLNSTINGYKGLITEFKNTAKQISGPVKIVEIGAQLSGQGSSGLALFAALISINLAVLNALPLPLLDGGQLMLVLIEGIRGKPLPERIQLAFMQSGFLLILGISILLIIRDTSQLSIIQELLGH